MMMGSYCRVSSAVFPTLCCLLTMTMILASVGSSATRGGAQDVRGRELNQNNERKTYRSLRKDDKEGDAAAVDKKASNDIVLIIFDEDDDDAMPPSPPTNPLVSNMPTTSMTNLPPLGIVAPTTPPTLVVKTLQPTSAPSMEGPTATTSQLLTTAAPTVASSVTTKSPSSKPSVQSSEKPSLSSSAEPSVQHSEMPSKQPATPLPSSKPPTTTTTRPTVVATSQPSTSPPTVVTTSQPTTHQGKGTCPQEGTCPNPNNNGMCQSKVQCLVDPCEVNSCTSGVCEANYCGGCHAICVEDAAIETSTTTYSPSRSPTSVLKLLRVVDDEIAPAEETFPTTAPSVAIPTVQVPNVTFPYETSTAAKNNHMRSSNNRDLFLLSGQSNMVGHTSSKQSIGGNGDYWNSIKSILDQGGNLDTMEQKLYKVIYKTNSNNDQVATTLTNGVMDLYKSSLLNDLDTPLTFGRCSFKEARKVKVDDVSNEEASKFKVNDVSNGTVPIVWNANCGHTFGHELLFSRTLELGMNYTNDFELHKVARGGSGLFEHWYPNHGQHWNLLKEAIEERRVGQGVDWKGFIWHQGSQEAWSEEQYGEDRSLTYYGNLTGLVNEVRELMFQNSMTWRCKEEIPVVIVQVGYWPRPSHNAAAKQAAQRTRDAQARFCNEDPRAVLVKTNDLSRLYHYDAASFLISGNRIAHAYQEALGGVVECPDRASKN